MIEWNKLTEKKPEFDKDVITYKPSDNFYLDTIEMDVYTFGENMKYPRFKNDYNLRVTQWAYFNKPKK